MEPWADSGPGRESVDSARGAAAAEPFDDAEPVAKPWQPRNNAEKSGGFFFIIFSQNSLLRMVWPSPPGCLEVEVMDLTQDGARQGGDPESFRVSHRSVR